MLTPNKLKPLSRHKDMCIMVGVDPILIRGVIKSYYNQLVDGLVVQTIQTMTLLAIAAIGIVVLLVLATSIMSFASWWTLLTIAVIALVVLVLGAINSTANERISRILKKIEQHGEENLKCFGIVIKRHYKTNRGRCIVEAVCNNKTIKIEVEDFIFDLCVSGSKLLLFCYGDDVLFCCPLKFFEDFMQGSEPLSRKIRFSDVKEYYVIVITQWFNQLKEMIQEERKHYSKCIDDLKKKK